MNSLVLLSFLTIIFLAPIYGCGALVSIIHTNNFYCLSFVLISKGCEKNDNDLYVSMKAFWLFPHGEPGYTNASKKVYHAYAW